MKGVVEEGRGEGLFLMGIFGSRSRVSFSRRAVKAY